MALMPRIKQLLQRTTTASTVGRRRETPHPAKNVIQEDALRAMLAEDPNNEHAFLALVDVVGRNCAEDGTEHDDPLAAEIDITARTSRDEKYRSSLWALAEEYAGHPKAWFPLVQLARLSLPENPEDATRRLNAAVSRDDSGAALATALMLLREFDLASEAYLLGVGHWIARQHLPEAGVQVVRASLDAGRFADARRFLAELLEHSSPDEVDAVDAALVRDVNSGANA
ncbi:hypothetical protein [Jonesia quinghaiensis]|uniref:hypothetical protein n=1 Tax=Jonesia quinghaiensis TaxID=262806 RepID=UPI000421F7ED|nr:hypothetical protein [Jonesia quinghaiensis]